MTTLSELLSSIQSRAEKAKKLSLLSGSVRPKNWDAVTHSWFGTDEGCKFRAQLETALENRKEDMSDIPLLIKIVEIAIEALGGIAEFPTVEGQIAKNAHSKLHALISRESALQINPT